jgi:hypothetical protein
MGAPGAPYFFLRVDGDPKSTARNEWLCYGLLSDEEVQFS